MARDDDISFDSPVETSERSRDTDGDGVSDVQERLDGTDPEDASDQVGVDERLRPGRPGDPRGDLDPDRDTWFEPTTALPDGHTVDAGSTILDDPAFPTGPSRLGLPDLGAAAASDVDALLVVQQEPLEAIVGAPPDVGSGSADPSQNLGLVSGAKEDGDFVTSVYAVQAAARTLVARFAEVVTDFQDATPGDLEAGATLLTHVDALAADQLALDKAVADMKEAEFAMKSADAAGDEEEQQEEAGGEEEEDEQGGEDDDKEDDEDDEDDDDEDDEDEEEEEDEQGGEDDDREGGDLSDPDAVAAATTVEDIELAIVRAGSDTTPVQSDIVGPSVHGDAPPPLKEDLVTDGGDEIDGIGGLGATVPLQGAPDAPVINVINPDSGFTPPILGDGGDVQITREDVLGASLEAPVDDVLGVVGVLGVALEATPPPGGFAGEPIMSMDAFEATDALPLEFESDARFLEVTDGGDALVRTDAFDERFDLDDDPGAEAPALGGPLDDGFD